MALEHIVMHLALCKAVARLSPRTTVAVRFVVTDKIGRTAVDRTVQIQRGTGTSVPVEFDTVWGEYRVDAAIPKYKCGGSELFYVLQDHDRTLDVTLSDVSRTFQMPIALVFGALPVSFAYAQPTVVTFSPTVPCNSTVSDPAPSGIDNEIEQDAYYATVRTPLLYQKPQSVTVALQLKDASGGYHYLRIPWQIGAGRYSWPNAYLINIDDGVIGSVAQGPEDTLQCLKGYMTTNQ